MKTRLTLQEKLRDLRDERKLKLQDAADKTGIPLTSLSRIETNDDARIGYQDIATLAKFYDVSTDYLFGVTDNRQHRNIEIDALSLSDSAIEMLKSKRLNNRLVSELLAHTEFQRLIGAIEIYIDKKLLPAANQMNAVYKLAETAIRENYGTADNANGETADGNETENSKNATTETGRDEILLFLQNAVIDEDEYLRYRISERFNTILKSLFAAHKNDELSPEQTEAMNDMKEMVQTYLNDRKTEPEARAKVLMLCKQLGLNAAKLTDDELRVLIKTLERSPLNKRGGRRK